MRKIMPLLALALARLAHAQTDATAVTYTGLPSGGSTAGAQTIHVSDRLYPYGFAVDFCSGIADGIHDNTTCLQYALNATGVEFATLEIQPPIYATSGNATVSSTTVTATSGNFLNLAAGEMIQIPNRPHPALIGL